MKESSNAYVEYEYDDRGNMIKSTQYENGEITFYTINEYNVNNDIVSFKTYTIGDRLFQYGSYAYDDKGQLSSATWNMGPSFLNPDGPTTIYYKYNCNYEFSQVRF